MTTHALGAESTAINRRLLEENHTLAVSLIGNSGSGKTSLIETTATRLWDMQIGVIIGHPAADRDVERLSKLVRHVTRIDEWPLDPEQLQHCLTRLDLAVIDLLLIEVGGGGGGIEHADVGQDLRVGVFSVSGGDDKLGEFPERAAESDLLVLSKIDLVPYIPFNLEAFRGDARRINPAIPLLETSIVTREGLREWEEWLRRHIQQRRPSAHAEQTPEPEWFFG
jgi:hydrogenase nickel incorporation protein HypB